MNYSVTSNICCENIVNVVFDLNVWKYVSKENCVCRQGQYPFVVASGESFFSKKKQTKQNKRRVHDAWWWLQLHQHSHILDQWFYFILFHFVCVGL